MDNLKKLTIYSKLRELDDLIHDKRIVDLLNEYRINHSDVTMPKNHFLCSKCNVVKSNDYRYNEMYGCKRKYFDKCIDCQDKYVAEYHLRKQLHDNETILQKRIKFINVDFYYKYRVFKNGEKYSYIDEICKRCRSLNSNNYKSLDCNKNCPHKKRISFLCNIVNVDIENKFKKIDSIITKDHIELRRLIIQLNRRIKEKKEC